MVVFRELVVSGSGGGYVDWTVSRVFFKVNVVRDSSISVIIFIKY